MKIAASTLTLTLILSAIPAFTNAQDKGASSDNTNVNKRDRKSGAVTADQQKENTSDRETTASIRKALMDDKDLSTYAHNVKIVTVNGKVTLKGPVRGQDEKKSIEAKAMEIAGAANVKSMITVKPKS